MVENHSNIYIKRIGLRNIGHDSILVESRNLSQPDDALLHGPTRALAREPEPTHPKAEAEPKPSPAKQLLGPPVAR
jgi:hypothetical protein